MWRSSHDGWQHTFTLSIYLKWWSSNRTYQYFQVHGEYSRSQLHPCLLLKLYRSHQELSWPKERVMSGMSDWTNNQKASLLTTIQQQNRQKVLLTFPYKLGESGELFWSAVVDLITNIGESVVVAWEEWCSNRQFNIKMSAPRTSLYLVFFKKESL